MHNYEGKWEMSKKLDEKSIDWSSGNDGPACLSTRFDQDLLRAKNIMKGGMKNKLMEKIQAKKNKAQK